MVDISKIGYVERSVDILYPPTKEPIGLTITLMSPDDARLDPFRNALTNKRLAEQARNKHAKAEDLSKDRDMFLFRAMTGWVWAKGVDFDGEQLEFNQLNVLKVFDKLPWVRKQVDEEFSNLEGFFTRPD